MRIGLDENRYKYHDVHGWKGEASSEGLVKRVMRLGYLDSDGAGNSA